VSRGVPLERRLPGLVWVLAQQLQIELPGLGFWLAPQLALQHLDRELVLLERRATAVLAQIQAHERAMRRLLQRVEGEQAHGGLNGALGRAGLALAGQQPGEGLERQLPQPLAFGDEPFLEQRLVQAEAREQIACIDRRGLLERLRRAFRHVPFEAGDVDVDHGRVQRKRLAFGDQDRRGGGRQRPSQGGERVAQAVAGSLVGRLAPEERGEPVARVGVAGLGAEVGQQRLGLAGGQVDGATRPESGLKPTE
jgi:hypothetical protein